MLKPLAVIPALLFIAACASKNPSTKFPDFSANPDKVKRIAVIVDVLMTSDIDGNIDGIYELETRDTLPHAGTQVRNALELKGFYVPELHVNGGLISSDLPELHFAKDDESTGSKVSFPLFQDSSFSHWTHLHTREFLQSALINSTKTGAKKVTDPVTVPLHLAQLGVDAIMIVGVLSRDVGMGKSIGVGLLTAIPSMILSPGFVFSSYPTSGAVAVTALVDLRTGEVLWRHTAEYKGGSSGKALIPPVLTKIMAPFPSRKIAYQASIEDSRRDNLTWINPNRNETDLPIWSIAKLKRAYKADEISREVYNIEVQRLKVWNNHQRQKLKLLLNSGEIDRYFYDLESLITRWRFEGNAGDEIRKVDAAEFILAHKLHELESFGEESDRWTRKSLNAALSNGRITEAKFEEEEEKLATLYKQKLRELKAAVKNNEIDAQTFDLELLKLKWTVNGLGET